jgi:spermidine synthase
MPVAATSETPPVADALPDPSGDRPCGRARLVLALFTASSFLGAGLLFAVQPMVAKMLLPLLGGSPAVWNTAMVFFQLTLLAGYAYAHFAVTRFRPPVHRAVQVGLIAVPLLLLPVAVPSGWLAPTDSAPIGWVLVVLLVMVGAPFFALSTLSPTLQRWLADTDHPAAANPYFLYAAGNAGSLLSLLAYPLVLEPTLGVETQTHVWMAAYVLLVLIVGATALLAGPGGTERFAAPASGRTPTPWPRRAFWGYAAFVPSALMLGVTRHLSTDIASFPLLWVVPLALYLLTFVIAFRSEPHREVRAAAAVLRFSVIPAVLMFGSTQATWLLLTVPLLLFTAAAVVAHGRLMLSRPDPSGLTEFYLWISIGGAAGGVFAALVAPLVFDRILEYPIAIALALTLLPVRSIVSQRIRSLSAGVIVLATAAGILRYLGTEDAWVLAAAVVTVTAYVGFRDSRAFAVALVMLLGGLLIGESGTLATDRTFFGVHRVYEADDGRRVISSGTTVHGIQLPGSDGAVPSGYYHPEGPIGQVLTGLWDHHQLDVGVIGLGAGTLAAYARPTDTFTFYEIDPAVVEIATNPELFTYVDDAQGQVEFVIGDGRVMLDRSGEVYDAVVLDAFSSDSIPTHLITREALGVYLDHLRPDGLLAIHISNRHLDLEPVIGRLATELGLSTRSKTHDPSAVASRQGSASSTWVTLARADRVLDDLGEDPGWIRTRADGPLWTDSYTSLLSVFRWG